MDWNIVIFPAYYLEAVGFNPEKQPTNSVAREMAARIVALVTPVFYAYQVILCSVITVLDLMFALCMISPGIACQAICPHVLYSIVNLFSSFLEIPEKVVFGPSCSPNYVGDVKRYHRMDQLEQPVMLI